ncbi:cyclic nucleotide-gated cation channel alpha-3-like, partial [Eriocheir sinensis]|uniref:cyclic nucleotide-gated cation channel alpha-3-like n=1 Tax=Eriocheir sinensis TaxID=95602 RepID=UPI0021CA3B11
MVSFLGGSSPPTSTPPQPRPRSPSSPACLRTPRGGSRRVSLIPGEALENPTTSLALASLLHAQESGGMGAMDHSPTFPQSLLPQGDIERPKPRVMKAKTTEEVGDHGAADVGEAATANSSPVRMKSNQRWLKLRTTVQLSGALSSSMNKSKPPLKREDSFIKRFSTRQIAEIQDTVDQTDEEDISKTSTGSPKVRKKKKKRQPRTVINPYGNVYFYWLCSLTICVLYNLWTPIVRQAFPELQRSPQPMWYLLDGLTDIIFVVDILVQFRTGYLEQGLIVYDFKKLARHYMQSRSFMLDLVSLFPLDFLQLLIGAHPIIRFPRFVKVYRVYNYYYMVESRTLYPNMWRVVNLIHILLLLAHWFGCFYYMLSEAEHFRGDWTYPYHHDSAFKTLSRKYLGSVYWSTLTLTTIGDLPTPETNKQYIFTIVSYLIGVFIFATIVGQVGNVITNRNANRLEFERLLDGAKLYMRHHKVPRAMQRRVQRWYDYSWSRGRIQGGGDINTALGLLPDKLRTELALHVNLLTLKKVSIFKECQPEFLHDLVLKMKAYIFTPGDLICRKGEVAREMFIIADGILEVISETGKVLTTMKAGDFFGEIGILNLDGLNKRTADVRSVGYSELFSLSREDVLMAMKDYPEAQEILQSLGRKRLMEARHTTSKSGSSGSSKRGTPSPNRDGLGEDKNAKKIVSRLRSDVSAIRNAFRRSKGATRDADTMEMDALDTRSSPEDDTPAVKRILKRISGRSGSDSSAGQRGVLKRMARVTSDETSQGTSPGRAHSGEEAPGGVLGAGLPLLQRLKLLKEKEEKEDKERQQRA